MTRAARGADRRRTAKPPPDRATSRFTTSDGTALHVVDTGPRDAGTTVVLLHGWTLDHSSWNRVADALPGRVLRYDHRGHGASAPAAPGTATIERLARDLAELLADRVPTGRVVLAGHSMGGMTIMALAETHPELLDRVAGVALVATSCGGLAQISLGLPERVAALVARGEKVVNRRIAALRGPVLLRRPRLVRPALRWLLFGARPDRADVTATAETVARCHPAALVAFRESLSEHERREALAALAPVPSVVLAGGADRLTPVPHAAVIADELPRTRLVVLPGAGHMLPLERPAEVATRIARLLR
ncbi:alpha/beta fold hydrolase [Umezawaea beigongshangensis]|uniref:alpha/beta fold hydrolase n=1 Tax=Umezawaea beigongshangensis TaxID=2780383 RepID=UPI0018F1E835|nr:alpha/beta fold hydrolase [Umezawaea beigongshangensis]